MGVVGRNKENCRKAWNKGRGRRKQKKGEKEQMEKGSEKKNAREGRNRLKEMERTMKKIGNQKGKEYARKAF